MFSFLSSISFLNAPFLLALLALPLLYWILKQIPPAPKRLSFGTLFLLQNIVEKENEVKNTPFWLLLLRMLIIALIILAFANPMHKQTSYIIDQKSPLLIVVDNGWQAAQSWNEKKLQIKNLIQENTEFKKPIFILETAGKNNSLEPMATREAIAFIDHLEPNPFPAPYEKMPALLQNDSFAEVSEVFYFDDGAVSVEEQKMIDALHAKYYLLVFTPKSTLPLAYMSDINPTKNLTLHRLYAKDIGHFQVQFIGENGSVLDTADVQMDTDTTEKQIDIKLHQNMASDLRKIKISDQTHLGASFVFPPLPPRKNIGILSISSEHSAKQDYLDANFYIDKALAPFHNIHYITPDNLELEKLNVLFVTDNALLNEEISTPIANWVTNGGILIRFADDALFENQYEDLLLPVQLRSTGRHLEGALSWDKPQNIASFPEHSPLRHIEISKDVAIQKQILAEPSLELTERSWANLDDGTPLITAEQRETGWVILFHVSATASWSNLPLSGMYVSMLKEIANLSSLSFTAAEKENIYRLYKKFDAFGNQVDATGEEIPLSDVKKFIPSAETPLGLYEQNSSVIAMNLAPYIGQIDGFRNETKGYNLQNYSNDINLLFKPYLLLAAFALFIFDLLLMVLRGDHYRYALTFLLFAFISFAPQSAHAQTDNKTYSEQVYLAYVKTGDPTTDKISEAGLKGLMDQVIKRTSADIGGVVGVNIETDELGFFPLIYWPVTSNQQPISQTAGFKIENYFHHGGTILFDTKDQFTKAGDGTTINRNNSLLLRDITQYINIPPLKPIADDHVLHRSFYLLNDFPGLYNGGGLWVSAETDKQINDGVTPILVGGNDWASAWAVDDQNYPLLDVPQGGERQREMSYRFGVNIVMYVLTGNYKDDQVHIPFILERLGQ